MHTVVLGWLGISAVWLAPLFWRLVKAMLPGGQGLRGPGSIRLWLGFVGVLVASSSLEAMLAPASGHALGQALAALEGRLIGHVAAPLAMSALFFASLPWLIGFRWIDALRRADRAFGLGLHLSGEAADERPTAARGERARAAVAAPTRTTTVNAMAPKSTGRYARPTVWRPPVARSGTAPIKTGGAAAEPAVPLAPPRPTPAPISNSSRPPAPRTPAASPARGTTRPVSPRVRGTGMSTPPQGSGAGAGSAARPRIEPIGVREPLVPSSPSPSPGVLETLRAIEANAAQWTTLAGVSLARRGASANMQTRPVDDIRPSGTEPDEPVSEREAPSPTAAADSMRMTGDDLDSADARPPATAAPSALPAQTALPAHEPAVPRLDAPTQPAPFAATPSAGASNTDALAAPAALSAAPRIESAPASETQAQPLGHSSAESAVASAARLSPHAPVLIELVGRSSQASEAGDPSGASMPAERTTAAVPSHAAASSIPSSPSPSLSPLPPPPPPPSVPTTAPARMDVPGDEASPPLLPEASSGVGDGTPEPAPVAPPHAMADAMADSAAAAPARPAVLGHAPTEFAFHAPLAACVELPSIELLEQPAADAEPIPTELLAERGQLIEQRLQEFKVPVTVVGASAGPVITRFEIEPALGVRGSQIVGLMKDLSRGLGLTSIRVVETIPGKTCMGLELPNQKRQMIRLSEILAADAYRRSASKLTIAMGKDITGNPIVTDLAKAPHMLVAGTTGSGKSVAINAMILSLLFKATPEEVRLIMIDPKMLELSVYEGIPHLLAPVVTDMKLAANALNWCVGEMEKRYRLMSAVGVRNLASFNQKVRDTEAAGRKLTNPFSLTPDAPEPLSTLPLIVVVIDELADLMMVAGKKIEELIARLAQKARAAGIHLILATQRPSVDVITGLIKANIPTRVAFQVSSKIDSRTILDQMGAESLLGQGDMLFLPPGTGYPQRVHGAFVADEEVHRVVEHLKQFGEPQYEEGILDGPATEGAAQDLFGDAPDAEADPLYDEAVAFVVRTRRASISAVQRQLRIGYNRAARLVEQMEAAGLVSSMGVNGSREVLAPPGPEQ
ncbi:DNA translocase FtsK [Trinickia caryophylli]|uniref:DNA segregation ATPase FtsK/SpoIIIE, S-DNA-T family n=1 Tax=Trinickia caryophylli TaxID=28094 RepID=A0A1X7GV14_TRICW|nr:DNA translocase FtsK [Trinickia caryophylli]PMS08932.1 cell division protein FtsK [Trinickia caryophylli]TRX18141.1 cell division protein FtsK [Trinickia caryophylli]WQE11075.1 DNA translocase FtsK [Trinickia caryophylli]SMF74395.1 DNA segregation ATPase FtsK/SpoIIIE, S-DNA-T family [Trinickia caryophylli]GLU35229.1 hypothetical protein Busp01_50710 [Trinickia caryophylli]